LDRDLSIDNPVVLWIGRGGGDQFALGPEAPNQTLLADEPDLVERMVGCRCDVPQFLEGLLVVAKRRECSNVNPEPESCKLSERPIAGSLGVLALDPIRKPLAR
jgi:hypothetical protein